MRKSNFPLITGCAILGGNDCSGALAVTGTEPFTFTLSLSFNLAILEIRFFRSSSGGFSDLLDARCCTPGHWAGRAAPETIGHCSKFPPFVDNCSLCGSLESRSLIDGFASQTDRRFSWWSDAFWDLSASFSLPERFSPNDFFIQLVWLKDNNIKWGW